MKRCFIILIFAGLSIATLSTAAMGQTCGDVNNDSQLNILDLAYYLSWLTASGPAPPVLWTADLDDIQGHTIADVVKLSDHFFGIPMPSLDCFPGSLYSCESSNADTVFLPIVTANPILVNEIELPIVTSFTDSVVGMHLAVLNDGTNNSGHYKVKSTWHLIGGNSPLSLSHHDSDSSLFSSTRIAHNTIADGRTHFSITFDSTGMTGIGQIDVDPVDRSPEWRSCIVKKDGQLYIPVFATLEHTYNQINVDEAVADLTATVGVDSVTNVITRSLQSNHDIISWAAEADQDWIMLDKISGLTPDEISISADFSDLTYGWHRGTVTIYNTDFPRTFPRRINVSLQLLLVNYPGADADCDGSFNIGDVAHLINYLFGDPDDPEPCEPCAAAAENYPPMDLNCDGKTNVTDVVRAMRYMFEIPTGAVLCNRCAQ